ncbi:DENN domain-containing protein 1B [Merluccius polli]|uniref:DENN domain-containing protein 1B n=1 Tax=Merluccius polli TaxID=89951 RepID=A0AA47MRX9_MERPO|nr:DENN domain-containing protein 1B [Merluccius polli]
MNGQDEIICMLVVQLKFGPGPCNGKPKTIREIKSEGTDGGSGGCCAGVCFFSDAGMVEEAVTEGDKTSVGAEVLRTVPKFCFPLDVERVSHSQVGQNFSFVLTDIDSKQRFGFCRLNQGCRICICLLSYLPWFEIYYKLLNTLADYLTKHQENDLNDMLNSLYDMPVPTPYTPINLNVNEQLYIATGHVLRDRRSVEPHSYFIAPDINGLPTIPESRNLTEYFVAVDITNMLQLYASMLHERRIIVTSSKLSTLTACVHGAAAMLYPMYWQHIFIPVLPPHLLDYCWLVCPPLQSKCIWLPSPPATSRWMIRPLGHTLHEGHSAIEAATVENRSILGPNTGAGDSVPAPFLLAIALVKRVSELDDLSISSECLCWNPEGTLWPKPSFLTKRISDGYVNQPFSLAAFEPPLQESKQEGSPDLLCPVWALRSCVDRTAVFRQSDTLFVSYTGVTAGCALSKQKLSNWIFEAIVQAYRYRGLPERGYFLDCTERCSLSGHLCSSDMFIGIAPMPYLVGVHLSLLERVRSRSLEDVVILNVDTNTLESPADDLQNLPSDVVSSLKSKLKKQSTATGSGVSRAFLRAQAALFGSYRDALRYKPGEPITFCEESFANHRSSAMRNFLSMAINLQLFKQFIDGRLAKLNAGRGFTDVFEEEITEGGFCGSNSRSYQQWMHTVKRGGALINTAVTKARSHAKKGLRDIKGRLKAREEEDEGATLCAGSPTSTKSLSPRRLQKMRRQQQNFSRPGLNMTAQDMGFDDDELDTASKLSSEDSGEVGSLMEDSDDSYSLELEEMASPQAGQMNLLDEILDSLSSSKTLDQGRLSAAKSLDFLKSSEDVDYAGLNKSTASSDCKAASGGVSGDRGEPGAWHTGQDDSSLHGKHLPPSPRRMPNKSSLRGLHRRPLAAPPARPTRPITMMAPVTGGSLAPHVVVPCRPQSDHLAASPPPSRRSAASDPPLTSTSLSRSAPPARPVESPPEIPRQGSRNHRGNPAEALVPWEKEAGEQRATEVISGKARGSVGGLKEGGLLGGFHSEDFLGGVQEKGLLEEIDYTLQNSPRLAPRLQRSSNTEACVRRVRIKPADLQKS